MTHTHHATLHLLSRRCAGVIRTAPTANSLDEQPEPLNGAKSAKMPPFKAHNLVRLVEVVADPDVMVMLANQQARQSRSALDSGRLPSIWDEGGIVETKFNDPDVVFATPAIPSTAIAPEVLRDALNPNTVDFGGVYAVCPGPTLQQHYNKIKSKYTEVHEKFSRSGQNDPNNIVNFARGDQVTIYMYYRYLPLSAVPGHQSLSRGLPLHLGAEEGFGEVTACGIGSLPKRKRAVSQSAAAEPDASTKTLVDMAQLFMMKELQKENSVKEASKKTTADKLKEIYALIVEAKKVEDNEGVVEYQRLAKKLREELVKEHEDQATA